MGYKELVVPVAEKVGSAQDLALVLRGASEGVLSALEAYRKARRGERLALEVRPEEVEWTEPSAGRLKLRWREELDLACRLERVGEGLSATVGFRLEPRGVVLAMLDEADFGERVDEI